MGNQNDLLVPRKLNFSKKTKHRLFSGNIINSEHVVFSSIQSTELEWGLTIG